MTNSQTKGWIVYNGSSNIEKITKLVHHLKAVAKEQGVFLEIIKNTELIVGINTDGELRLKGKKVGSKPDFVLFWDKDILLAKYLEKMNISVFNSADAIALCDDKAKMHLHLAEQGIKIPKTILAPLAFYEHHLPEEYYEQVSLELGYPMILKEAYGSFGMQVYKIENERQLREKVASLGKKGFLMQEYIQSSCGRDIRVNIIGNRVIGAMLRTNPVDFRANITLGGTAQSIFLTEEQEALALRAHQAMNLSFSGIDLLFGKEEMLLCEVNSNVNFLSFEQATGISFAKPLIEYIIREIK